MDAVGHFVTEEDVEEMMLAADLDGNGSIDYNDFLTFLADLNETKLN
jgi:Ca2+-binding EF-hand superfamily protein